MATSGNRPKWRQTINHRTQRFLRASQKAMKGRKPIAQGAAKRNPGSIPVTSPSPERAEARQNSQWQPSATARNGGRPITTELDAFWRQRMLADGPPGLWEVAPGRGRKPRAGLAAKVIEATLSTKPKGQTHWSSRGMAREQGVHHSTVARVPVKKP
jgi:hypothetical protein